MDRLSFYWYLFLLWEDTDYERKSRMHMWEGCCAVDEALLVASLKKWNPNKREGIYNLGDKFQSCSHCLSAYHYLSLTVSLSQLINPSISQFLITKFGHAVSVSQFIILLVSVSVSKSQYLSLSLTVSVSMYKTKLQWVLFITVMFARSELP